MIYNFFLESFESDFCSAVDGSDFLQFCPIKILGGQADQNMIEAKQACCKQKVLQGQKVTCRSFMMKQGYGSRFGINAADTQDINSISL